MKFLIIFTCAILASNAFLERETWAVFKTNHNKIYKNIVEEKMRFQIFQNNLKTINDHNSRYAAGLESWYMGINQFADMTTKEFSQILKRQQNSKPNLDGTIHEISADAPDSIDWREKGAVLEVKDQGSCGSCWAFSATGALEGQNAIIYNRTVSLSEQQLLDCSTGYGNGDCMIGGDMILAFEYVIDNGIDSETKYPYTAVQGNCQASGNHEVKVIGYKSIPQNEEALKNAVGVVGPISVAIYAEPIQFYSGGIFKSDDCTDDLDHGVLAVGYGTAPEPYWIVKNSWGASWGEQGFFRIARNIGQCGIALDTSYPIIFTRN